MAYNPYAIDNPTTDAYGAPLPLLAPAQPQEYPVQGSDGYWYLHGQRVPGPGGASPQQQGATNLPGNAPAGVPVPSSGYDNGVSGLLNQQYDLQRQIRDQNLGFINNTVMPAIGTANQAGNQAVEGRAENVNNSLGQIKSYQDQNNALAGYGWGNAQQANAADQQTLSDYGTALGGIQGAEYGLLGNLSSVYGGMSQLSATPQVANQQAALAQQTYANYQTAQLYQAALERARANPDDVQAQKEALRLSTLISQGSNDVQNGGLTPEAKQAQLSALKQYGELTSPEVTAKERFLYESQRQKQEQEEAASRAALMDEYRVKGMGGSGMELGSILQSGQQNSQERLLGDLGTQAGAVDRSMQALAGYGNLSSTMMQQGNQVDQFNMSQRLQALGMRADIANNIAAQSQQLSEYNAGQANNVNMFNAGQANQNAQFNANAYNQNSMFNAGQANNISMYNAGQVNAVGMNNTNQNMIQGRFADQFRADQQAQQWGRATDLTNTGLQVTGNQRTDVNNLTGAKFSTNQNAYNRNDTAIGNAATLGSRNYNAGQTGVAQTDQFWQDYANNPALAAQRAIQAGGLYTGANSSGGAAITDQGNRVAANQASQDALRAASYTPIDLTSPSAALTEILRRAGSGEKISFSNPLPKT